jgi:hypothetical protein
MDAALKEKLPEILEAHRLWLQSEAIEGALADLSEADLSRADLIDADLSHAKLIDADLSHAKLIGADLSYADLGGADLIGADLSGANLYRADLSHAKLIDADLSRANLSGANLSEAHLSCADLGQADLIEAVLINSNLSQVDISGACLDDANTSRWKIEGIICTHLVTGLNKTRIDYSPNEFEQRNAYAHKLAEIVLNLPLSELTHYVGLMTESAINQHQPDTPIRFKGQEALSDKTTKLSFVAFTSDDDGLRKVQDQLNTIQQNLTAVAGDMKEIRQFVEDERQAKDVFGVPKEIPVVPGLPAPVIRRAELERKLTERYNLLPSILQKVWECIQSSFPH